MSEETTTDRLAEIEGQAADYTPPEGWRKLQVGEAIHPGDAWHYPQADVFETDLIVSGVATSDGHYLRRIEPQPQPEPEAQPVQVREGRWRTRGGEVRNVTRTPDKHELRDEFPWWDANNRHTTWRNDGRYSHERQSMFDLLEYLGPIESEPEPTITPDDVAAEALQQQLETTEAALLEQQQQNGQLVTHGSQQRMQIAELRSEVSHVQGLLGESRKAVNSAARDKADLQHRLDTVAAEWAVQAETIRGLESLLEAVKAELAQQAETSRRLQIELDAAQQVPADSPELRQLRADLAEVAHDRDTYRHAHELLLKDANTVHERTKAMTVEAIAEWLEPVRLIDSPSLANETLQHLPQIMRSLVGLDTPEDVD